MMKRAVIFVMILISLSYCSCNSCANVDKPTDPRVSACFFKVGSYFIYNDSIDHIIDSQYVFQYSYRPNFLPSMYDNCTLYINQYQMWETSYRNSFLYDSIYSSCNTTPGYIAWGEVGNYLVTSYDPGMDTSFNNFFVGGHIYPTVYKTGGRIYGVTLASDIIVDFYFAPGFGVVKRVEHRQAGDVNWDLIRYHILQ